MSDRIKNIENRCSEEERRMRSFVHTVVSLILFLSLSACDSEQNSKQKSIPAGYSQINKLFGITEFSETVIREKWVTCLQMLEKEDWAEASKWCHVFSNSLIHLAKGVMVQERKPHVNALILEMSKRVMAITKKARNAKLRREPESDRNPVFEKDETDEEKKENKKKTETPDKESEPKEKYEIQEDMESIKKKCDAMWFDVETNDTILHILDIMNLVTFDEKYDIPETIEYELTDIASRLNEEVYPDIYIDVMGQIEFNCPKLVAQFYEKLQKIGIYSMKHRDPVQTFLDHIDGYMRGLKSFRDQIRNKNKG